MKGIERRESFLSLLVAKLFIACCYYKSFVASVNTARGRPVLYLPSLCLSLEMRLSIYDQYNSWPTPGCYDTTNTAH